MTTPKPLKPLIKWAGGKRWLVPILQPLCAYHQDKLLIEPFSGGLAVALGLNRQKAILADINSHLINFYQQVQKGLTPGRGFKNEADYFYEKRARFNTLITQNNAHSAEGARLFFYLMKTGFNGLCRFNQQGTFNVPFGQHQKINYHIDFKAYQHRFAHFQFKHSDFSNLKLPKAPALIYADPPYDVEFRQYAPTGFDFSDQIRLCEWLSGHKGPVIASNQATDRIIALYQAAGFHITTLKAPRRIACNGDRKPALEMLALKGFTPKEIKAWQATNNLA